MAVHHRHPTQHDVVNRILQSDSNREVVAILTLAVAYDILQDDFARVAAELDRTFRIAPDGDAANGEAIDARALVRAAWVVFKEAADVSRVHVLYLQSPNVV